MNETTQATGKVIKDFEIELSNSLYWISSENGRYPVVLTPYDFKRLFEIEGLPIEGFTGQEPLRFRRAKLIQSRNQVGGDIFDEEGQDITPQTCRVAEPESSVPADS